MSQGVLELSRIERNTDDLDRLLAFYRDALGFHVDDADAPPPAWMALPEIDATPTRCALLSLGAQQLGLTGFADAQMYPGGSRANDLWFQHCAIVADDMRAACARVLAHGATPITLDGPQTLPPSTSSVTAFKFRDPDGHPLELIHFPAGSGDPAWQAARARGIDHSAISVGDAARSIAFYELLGLHVATRGVNHGTAQQHLDGLDNVEVEVVAMQGAAHTPHLELLGYLRPGGRSGAAADVTAVLADRLVWHATAIDVLLDALADADCANAIVASGFVDGATVAVLRDPDGHLLVLQEAAPTA